MFYFAAISACVVMADHEACLKPLADRLASSMSQCDFQIKRLTANVEAASTAKSKKSIQADLDEQKKKLDRLTKRPIETLAETHGDSPFGLPVGSVVYAVSESATPVEVGDGSVVLSVLSYANGSGGRSEKQSTSNIGVGDGFTKPVLERLTVLATIPGAKKGVKFKLAGWYRVTESGGTKEEYTASAVPFRFSEADIAILLQLADQSEKRRR